MAHFALLWKARTIEKYRQNYENEKYLSIQETDTPIVRKSLSQRLRCYRQDTQKRLSKVFQKIYPEGSSLSHFFLYLKTDQTCLNFVLKSLLGFMIGLVLTYLCYLFLVFQLSITVFNATIVSSVIGVLLTMGLAFSYRIRCLIFLLLPQFFSRAGRYTLTCYALVLILTGPATNTLKNSEVLTESMACRQEYIKTMVKEVKHTMTKPLNSMRESIQIMVDKIRHFAIQMKQKLLKVNRLTLSVLETIQSTFLWLQWLSELCNKKMGSPYERCMKVLKDKANSFKRSYKPNMAEKDKYLAEKHKSICSKVKKYKAVCVFTDFVTGSFVTSIRRRLKDFSKSISDMLYLKIQVHHSFSTLFFNNTSDSASQVAAGIITEIRKRADPLLTWLSWSSCVTSLFLLLIIFRAKYYQHMFETRSCFDNKFITKELRDLDLNTLRHGKETVLPLNRRERSKYVSTTSFRLVTSEKINLNRSIIFMTITTFKLLIHMVADYSLYWVLMTIQLHGKSQTAMPVGVPNAGMQVTGKGHVADMFRLLLMALTSPLHIPRQQSYSCLPNPNPPDYQRYSQIGILIFLLWFLSLFEPYGLRLRHVVMGLYRPERAKARAEWLFNHILKIRAGFKKFARRKLHRAYKYHSEEKYSFKKWLNNYFPSWLRYILRISKEIDKCLLCGTKEIPDDPNTRLQKCVQQDCPGMYCSDCFSDIDEFCPICCSPRDYGDLSDVSFEHGSSDESEDDFDEGSDNNAKYDDDMDLNSFDSSSSDIFFPKPLRGKESQNANEKRPSYIQLNNMTYTKQTFEMNTDISDTNINSDANLIPKLDYLISLKNKNSREISSQDNIKTTYYRNNILKSISQTAKNMGGTRQTTNNQKPNDKKREGKQVSKDVKDGKKEKKMSADETDKFYPSTSKENNDKKSDKNNKTGQDGMVKSGEVSWSYLSRINTLIYALWPDMKISLLNVFKPTSQEIVKNNSNDDKNFKTRKKDQKIDRKIEEENARHYRILAYLAEQEWVVKKTITYKGTQSESSLLKEHSVKETIKCLKNDAISRNTINLLNNENDNTPLRIPALEPQVYVCDDCRYFCMCPGNPGLRNAGMAKPGLRETYPVPKCAEDDLNLNIVFTKKKSSLSKKRTKKRSKKKDTTKPGFLSRIFRCFKRKGCKGNKKKCKKCCVNQTTSTFVTKTQQNGTQYTDDKIHKHDVERKKSTHDVERKKSKHDVERKNNKHDVERKKGKHDVEQKNCQHDTGDQNKDGVRKKAKRKYKCTGELELYKRCDALCPEECDCKNQGIIAGKCDALCPEDCTCDMKGIIVEKCDPLCAEECCCGREGIIVDKCDALCPEDCCCGGHGVTVDSNYLCSGDCCCQETGTQWEDQVGNKQIAYTSMSFSKTKIKKKSKIKSSGSDKTKKEINKKDKKEKNNKKDSKKNTTGTTYTPVSSAKPSVCVFQMSSDKGYSGSTNSSSCASIEERRKMKRKPKAKRNKTNLQSTKKNSDECHSSGSSIRSSKKSTKSKKRKKKIKKEKQKNQVEKCCGDPLSDYICLSSVLSNHSSKKSAKSKKEKNKKEKQKDVVEKCCGYPPSDYFNCVSEESTCVCEVNYCSCAIQCPPLEAAHEESEELCCSVTDYENPSFYTCLHMHALTSDFTATDATIQHVYVERPRMMRVRRTNVAQRHQCIGTDKTRYTDTVGTITEDWDVRKDVMYFGNPKLYKRKCKREKCVRTKKIVSFRSRVQLIPNRCEYELFDIYTPSRYLLESQKYYNELYACAKFMPIKTFKIPAIMIRRIISQIGLMKSVMSSF